MNADFVKTDRIVNGYFYTFTYKPINKETIPTYDRNPFIYCVGPFEHDINCFMGLNLHLLPLKYRIDFMVNFDKASNFREADTRKIYTINDLQSNILPGCIQAIRVYNRKNIIKPYRVINQKVPSYIEYNGSIIMKNPGTLMNKYLLDLNANQTSESRK